MAVKLKITLLILLSCFLSSGVFAEEAIKGTYTDSDTLEYTLPEIIIEGDNSMHSLRMEVINAQELKFEVFNNLNSTDEFDIFCGWHAPLGTRIKEWSCDVEYMRKARAEAVQDWMERGGTGFPTDNELAIKLAHKTRALNKEMRALAVKNPELAVAMINAHELEQRYKEEYNKRFKDSILVGKQTEPKLALNKIDIWEAAFRDHSNGVISEEIWGRWDSMYRKLFRIKSYRILWESVNQDKYRDDFVTYVNSIVAGK